MDPSDDPGRELARRISEAPLRLEAVAALLDGLDSAHRVAAVRHLGRAQQRRLFAAAEGFLPLRLCDLVPSETGDGVTVRHFGRNTLPAFTLFEKRFCRPPGADPEKPGELFGFNFQPLSWLTGPGCFVAVEDPRRAEVRVDYRRLPPSRPEGWPEIRHNEGIPARFVYGFMVDTLRRVSRHVSVGSAARRGREIGSWFVLCREAS